MAVINRPTEPAAADSAAASEDAAPAATADQSTRPQHRHGAAGGVAAAPLPPRRPAPVASARPSAGTRVAAAGAGTAVLIARIITTIAGVVALIIALGIAFVVLKASPSNTIVSHVHDWAKWLVGPFDGMFHLHSARGTVALNWGIALVVYLVIGSLLARIVLTSTPSRRRRAIAARARSPTRARRSALPNAACPRRCRGRSRCSRCAHALCCHTRSVAMRRARSSSGAARRRVPAGRSPSSSRCGTHTSTRA